MQKYTEISEETSVEASRELLLGNDKTVASHFSGIAFPTENLVVGMECYRTDEAVKYRLVQLSPVRWEPIPNAAAITKIKIDAATRADTATTCSGNAATATKLQTARTINGVAFDGTGNITVTAAANGGTAAACTGNAATATKLQTARTINGVAFDGTGNITVTAAANGGNAATATKLQTARTINGVAFDGTGNITVTAAANGGTAASCSGNAATATKLQTARTINGVAFDGTQNISISGGMSIDTAITVEGSAESEFKDNVRISGEIPNREGGGYVSIAGSTITKQAGVGAGSYALKDLLQKLVTMSHKHGTVAAAGIVNCNCNCCNCGGE